MKINIQSVKFDADVKLVTFVETKISKLEKFDDTIISADVTMKIDKDHENGNKVVLVSIAAKGGVFVAERRSATFEEAADACVDAIKNQIDKKRK